MSEAKIIDVTFRDGGLTNNFSFQESYIREHLRLMALARVDYVEMGYKAGGRQGDQETFGPLKYCLDSYIRQLAETIADLPKLSFMVDVGSFERKDIAEAAESPFRMARVAGYLEQTEQAVQDVLFFQEKGYETTLNLMAISREQPQEIARKLRLIRNRIPEATVYLVDSYGALYPREMRELFDLYRQELAGMKLGIHAHNNLQLAFANTITALEQGAAYADGSVYGLGRGGGNCPLECLLPYVGRERYDLKPVLTLIERYYQQAEGEKGWRPSPQYLLTGLFNRHPVYSIQDCGDSLLTIYDCLQEEGEKAEKH